MRFLLSILVFVSSFACANDTARLHGFRFSTTAPVTADSTLLYVETFDRATYFNQSDTGIYNTNNIENCNPISANGGDTAHGTGYDLTLSRSDTGQAGRGGRFEINLGWPNVGSANRKRSEVLTIKGSTDSRFQPDMYYQVSFYVPAAGGESDTSHESYIQWFEDGGEDCTVKARGGKLVFDIIDPSYDSLTRHYDLFGAADSTYTYSNASANRNFTPQPYNNWHVFKFHFYHSQGSDGLVEIWRDGNKIQTLHGRTMHSAIFPTWKVGLYKSDWTTHAGPSPPALSTNNRRILFVDNLKAWKQ